MGTFIEHYCILISPFLLAPVPLISSTEFKRIFYSKQDFEGQSTRRKEQHFPVILDYEFSYLVVNIWKVPEFSGCLNNKEE